MTDTAPERLYDAEGLIFNTKDEDITGDVCEEPITYTLDLETVLSVRDDPDHHGERCIVDQAGGDGCTLVMSRADFAAVWRAYRRAQDNNPFRLNN